MERYQLVRPCYMHGIINGELVSAEIHDDVESIDIKRREVEEFMPV